jgi:hypothetical protein
MSWKCRGRGTDTGTMGSKNSARGSDWPHLGLGELLDVRDDPRDRKEWIAAVFRESAQSKKISNFRTKFLQPK